jgi:hypothetical protein
MAEYESGESFGVLAGQVQRPGQRWCSADSGRVEQGELLVDGGCGSGGVAGGE